METPHVIGPRVKLVAVEPAFPFAVLGAGATFDQLFHVAFGFLQMASKARNSSPPQRFISREVAICSRTKS